MAAAAQLLALDGDQKLPARAAFRHRHLEQQLLGQRRATTASCLLSLGSSPRKPRGFTWGVEDGQSQHQQHPRLILTSLLPDAVGFPCRSLSFPVPPLFLEGTDQTLFFPFPTGKIQLCQHLLRCSIANYRPEVVLKQQLNLLGRHHKVACHCLIFLISSFQAGEVWPTSALLHGVRSPLLCSWACC